MRNKKLIIFGLVLILVAICGLLLPFMSFRFSDDYNFLSAAAHATDTEPSISPTPSSSLIPKTTPDPNLPNVSNRLVIKSAGVDMPIFEGATPDVLLRGGWLFPHEALPNASTGNTVIFGHRFRYLPPLSNTFYHLDHVKIGDEIKLTWNNHVYLYTVRETKVIEPTDLSVLTQTKDPILTLITCAPLFSTKQRLVVIASLVQ